ncbi:unnamed protein product [Cuscuta europaea]|uniref:Uncharacterized protein n=1 Tax=Cuscuta europaea TaxID=41803 RepID=A0A9P1EEM4_CUSEU|nr:unnamed protein product [Cuscuta europaea]
MEKAVGKDMKQYIEARKKGNLKQGLKMAMSLSGEGKAYLQENHFWKFYMIDRISCSIVRRTAAGIVYLLACLLKPFMPSFSYEIGKEWKEEEVERYREMFASSTETCVVIEFLKVTEANETSLDFSSAAEMSVISKDLVLKFLVQQSVKYWEGRGARMKWKREIMAVSYHPP